MTKWGIAAIAGLGLAAVGAGAYGVKKVLDANEESSYNEEITNALRAQMKREREAIDIEQEMQARMRDAGMPAHMVYGEQWNSYKPQCNQGNETKPLDYQNTIYGTYKRII